MNLSDRLYEDPLTHRLVGDTLIVDLIYRPGYGRFPFGEIKVREDTILLKLAGDTFREIPKIDEKFHVRRRYFRSEFKILIDSTKIYHVFFRHNDTF